MPRKTISSPSDKRVGQRRLDLEKVLRKAAQIPDVMNEPVFREFVGLETVDSGCAAALPPSTCRLLLLCCLPPVCKVDSPRVAIAPSSFCCTCLHLADQLFMHCVITHANS